MSDLSRVPRDRISILIDTAINRVLSGGDLSAEESERCLDEILGGAVSSHSVESLLRALIEKEESVSEILGFARAMRKHMIPARLDLSGTKRLFDCCGTGGVRVPRFNVSTCVAFILASAGIDVAKHGNVGSKKANGSFDFLDELGVSYQLDEYERREQFEKTHLTFLFAREFHPAMRFVAPIRKKIERRSIFNLLGPLSNPAGVSHQIIGVRDLEAAKKLAQVVLELGTTRTLLVVGSNGMDELETCGDNHILDVCSAKLSSVVFNAENVFKKTDKVAASIGSASANATLFRDILRTPQSYQYHPVFQQCCLNAGAAFYCVGQEDSIENGVAVAREQFLSGGVSKFFTRFYGLL